MNQAQKKKVRRLSIKDVLHEVGPGVRTKYFLSDAMEAAYGLFGIMFASVLEGGLFAKS